MRNSINESMLRDPQGHFHNAAEYQRQYRVGKVNHGFSPLTDAHIADVFERTRLETETDTPPCARQTKSHCGQSMPPKANAAAHSRFFEWALRRFD